MAARPEDADRLPKCYPFTDMQSGDHGLIRGADRAVVNADDRLASNRASEYHRAARGGQDGLTGLGDKINTAVPGGPGECWRSEPSLHHEHTVERPTGGRRQQRSSDGRTRNCEHAETNRPENHNPKVST
jgi:hypothetical protein